MTGQTSISGHWASGNVYGIILDALARASKPLDALTLDDLSPIDHFHARGFPATQSLGDRLPVQPGHALLDIGCGLGGPARYFADRRRRS